MTISIAMCTYNGARFLQEQLDSLALQSRLPYEIVVFDDCSTDNTLTILHNFAATAPFPVLIHQNESNVGVARNFQQAIEICRGELIALCDQDDVWRLDKLQILHDLIEASPDCSLVYSDAQLVDDELNSLSKGLWENFGVTEEMRVDLANGRGFGHLVDAARLTGCTMMFRSEWRPILFPKPDGTFLIHDGWIALVLSAIGRVLASPEQLVHYRQHSSQVCGMDVGPPLVLLRAHYERHAAHFMATYGHLKDKPLLPNVVPVVNSLPARTKHLKARLACKGLFRICIPLRELVTGRYHRYSKGMHTFLRDVLRPTP